jgi:hypothetical protein
VAGEASVVVSVVEVILAVAGRAAAGSVSGLARSPCF